MSWLSRVALLHREFAVKTLPESLTDHVERLVRRTWLRPSSADSEVTPASVMPQGTIRSNQVQVGVAVQCEAVHA